MANGNQEMTIKRMQQALIRLEEVARIIEPWVPDETDTNELIQDAIRMARRYLHVQESMQALHNFDNIKKQQQR